MLKIKNGDEVVVTTGRDKGKRGKVSKLLGRRVVVSGVNIVKRHQKPVPQKGIQGGVVEKESPIDISNVAIWNSATGRPDKVGIITQADGSKVRIFKSTKAVIA